jgi:hypothetical protein
MSFAHGAFSFLRDDAHSFLGLGFHRGGEEFGLVLTGGGLRTLNIGRLFVILARIDTIHSFEKLFGLCFIQLIFLLL